jgi:hypothetical protein
MTTARYVLTSTCLATGTMSLTQSLRVYLQGHNAINLRDEEGETYSANVNWAANRLEGLTPYYSKRRLGPNDKIALHLSADEIGLEALTPAAKAHPPKGRNNVQGEREVVRPIPERVEKPEKTEKRVKVTPYPREVMFPQVPMRSEVPAVSAELEQLGLVRDSITAPWVFRATMGRRSFSLALVKFGEMEAKELLAHRQAGKAQYAGIVAGESSRVEAMSEIDSVRPSGISQQGLIYLSPEALQRMVKLKAAFPIGALDLEKLLRSGQVDLESINTLEQEISGVLGERGHFSTVLTLLAELAPQQIFLLADLMPTAREMTLEADHLQSVLESLSNPPFLLLKRLSPGEFLMRQSVSQALADWAEYAQVMSNRLDEVLEK